MRYCIGRRFNCSLVGRLSEHVTWTDGQTGRWDEKGQRDGRRKDNGMGRREVVCREEDERRKQNKGPVSGPCLSVQRKTVLEREE